MAQDLIKTHPEAILTDALGYYCVRYDLLGLEMLTFADWQEQCVQTELIVNLK